MKNNLHLSLEDIKKKLKELSNQFEIKYYPDSDEWIIYYNDFPCAKSLLPFMETQTSLIQENGFVILPTLNIEDDEILRKFLTIIAQWNSY